MRAAVGVDVGGTKIAGAVVTADGETRDEETVATPPGDDDRSASATLGLIDRLVLRAGTQGLDIRRAGVGVPEYVTPQGRVTSAAVLPAMRDLPVVSESGLPILVDSDVRCAARAESRFGHGRNLASFVFVIIGTGISSTLVIGGRLWAGHRGEAIALGELGTDPALALRPGAPLTVEEQASGRAISKAADAGGGTDDPRESTRLRAAAEARAGEIIARALYTTVQLIDPAAVVVGGGLGSSKGAFIDSLSQQYMELTRGQPQPPPLMQAQLGPRAGVIGAGLLALEGRGIDLLGV
ncbi:MAG: ROK family protein [Acidimicrobiaceae bacterium]|nr:ROK family protein [Acidimicrobiaceae bacterium]